MVDEELKEGLLQEVSLTEPRSRLCKLSAGRSQRGHRHGAALHRALSWLFSLFIAFCLIGAVLWAIRLSRLYLGFRIQYICPETRTNEVYSPLAHLKAHDKTVVFRLGFHSDISMYQGPPTPEREAAWEDLYNFGILKIPRSSAAKLANKTVPIPGDTSNYVISIDVFHQLHCLNMVRKHIWATELGTAPQRTDEAQMWQMMHVDHCIDAIRQSLMCSADVSPLSWLWDDVQGRVAPLIETPHSCRDFDAIWRWGKEHLVEAFDVSVQAIDEDADFEPAVW